MDQNQGHQEETHLPTHMFRCWFLDLLLMECKGCGVLASLELLLESYTKLTLRQLCVANHVQ